MAGEAKTIQFNVSDGTLMIGKPGEAYNLTPETHSVGLIKQLTCTSTKNRIELTQGLQQLVVDSQVTGNDVSVTADVYEYTAKNLAYAAGLDGSEYKTGKTYFLKEAVNGDGDTTNKITIMSDSDPSSNFAEGQHLLIQAKFSGADDRVALGVVKQTSYTAPAGGSKATGTITVAAVPAASDQIRIGNKALLAGTDFVIGEDETATAANIAKCVVEGVDLKASGAVVTVTAAEIGTEGNAITLSTNASEKFTLSGVSLSGGTDGTKGFFEITLVDPLAEGMSFVAGDSVITVSFIKVASNDETPYVSVKMVFVLPNEKEPTVLISQKARVTNGFTLASTTDNYASMPFEITPYMLLPSDNGYDRQKKCRLELYKK